MITRCSNPVCNCVLQDLSKGRLFLLPPTYYYSESIKLSDYCYWLCPECDATYTITRIGSEVVIDERGPGTTYSVTAASRSRTRPGQVTLRSYTEVG